MNIDGNIIINIYLIATIIIVVILLIKLYFLGFRLKNHPQLIKLLDDTIEKICKLNNIDVYYLTEHDIIQYKIVEKVNFIGLYRSYKNIDSANYFNEKLNKLRQDYGDVINNDIIMNYLRLQYKLPQIIINIDEINVDKPETYYYVLFHELGHHYARLNELSDSEDDADLMGYMLVKKYLPKYFQLFYYFTSYFTINNNMSIDDNLSIPEKIIAIIEFLKVSIKKNGFFCNNNKKLS